LLPFDKHIAVIKNFSISFRTAHTYYYCTKNESGRWSFWQKIPVAIKENDADKNGPSGAHIFFAKLRGRYYLFMPEFIIRPEDKNICNGHLMTKYRNLSCYNEAILTR
jgi:Neuraminidase-like domain